MAAIARTARDTNAALVLAHHTRKSDGRYRDSTAIGAGVDVIVEMRAGNEPEVRRLQARARWPVEDLTVRLTANGYERAAGGLSIDARKASADLPPPGLTPWANLRRPLGSGGPVGALTLRSVSTSSRSPATTATVPPF